MKLTYIVFEDIQPDKININKLINDIKIENVDACVLKGHHKTFDILSQLYLTDLKFRYFNIIHDWIYIIHQENNKLKHITTFGKLIINIK